MTTWDIAARIIIGGAVLSLFAAGARCFAVDRAVLAVLFMLAAMGLVAWVLSQASFMVPL